MATRVRVGTKNPKKDKTEEDTLDVNKKKIDEIIDNKNVIPIVTGDDDDDDDDAGSGKEEPVVIEKVGRSRRAKNIIQSYAETDESVGSKRKQSTRAKATKKPEVKEEVKKKSKKTSKANPIEDDNVSEANQIKKPNKRIAVVTPLVSADVESNTKVKQARKKTKKNVKVDKIDSDENAADDADDADVQNNDEEELENGNGMKMDDDSGEASASPEPAPRETKKKTVNKAAKKVGTKNGIDEVQKVDKKKKRAVQAKVEDEEATSPPAKKSKKAVGKATKNSKPSQKQEEAVEVKDLVPQKKQKKSTKKDQIKEKDVSDEDEEIDNANIDEAESEKEQLQEEEGAEEEEHEEEEKEEEEKEPVPEKKKKKVNKTEKVRDKNIAKAKKRPLVVHSDTENEIVDAKKKPVKSKPLPKLNKTLTDFSKINFNLSDNKVSNMKIASWNVAGLRALTVKGGMEYINYEKPDIICFQEIKCTNEEVPEEAHFNGYHPYFYSKPGGRDGVSIYSKIMPYNVEYGLDDAEQDEECRIITAEYEKFFLICVYVPNSGRKLVTLPKRLKWNDLFHEHIVKLNKRKSVIICGDMNVSHQEIDLANPKTNKRNAGFTQEERNGMTKMLSLGFIDTFRELYPDKDKAYTFWTYMGNARAKNVGWRLDYFIASEKLKSKIVDNVMRTEVLGSDHCPIVLFLNI